MSTKLNVSGLEVHIYGLEQVRAAKASFVDVVFVLHGRTQSYKDYESFAQAVVAKAHEANPSRNLLVVAFDQRNHGHRLIDEMGNKGWADGNTQHAQDMFSIYFGTSQDVSLLITLLPTFLFPRGDCSFADITCTGISLGGHATYLVLSNDQRVKAGVVIIGCPDFSILMGLRAGERKDDLLPQAFLDTVTKLKPDVLRIAEKDVLILKGDEDILVPWSASEKFVTKLSSFSQSHCNVIGFKGVGHAFPEAMQEAAIQWIVERRAKLS